MTRTTSEHPTAQLAAYLDHELDAGQQRSLEAHLQACPVCRAELDEHLALRQLLLATPPVPQRTSAAAFWQGLEAQLQPRRTRLGFAWIWGIALAVSVLLIQTFFIALRLAEALKATGWLPALQNPVELRGWWGSENLPGSVQGLLRHNILIAATLDSPLTSFLPYLLTLILSSILALIFLGWAYAYLCPQSLAGCQRSHS